MGNTLTTAADQPDPTSNDGKKCVLSAKFADCKIPEDYDLFCAELVNIMQHPPGFKIMEMALKHRDIGQKETDAGLEFKCLYVIDAEKVKSASKGLWSPEKDFVAMDAESVLDKKNRTMITKMYDSGPERGEGDERTLKSTGVTKILDPMQIVYYWEEEEERVANEKVKQALDLFLKRIITNMVGGKVKMDIDAEKKIIQTVSPMDNEVTYDKFFSSYCQVIKAALKGPDLKLESEEKTEDVEVATYVNKDGEEAGFILITSDETKGTIVIERNFENIPLLSMFKGMKQYVEITQSPLNYVTFFETEDERYDPTLFFQSEKDIAEATVAHANSMLAGIMG